MNAQSALLKIQNTALYFKHHSFFFQLIKDATNSSVKINDEHYKFLFELVSELIAKEQTTAVEARNTAMWLNTLK